MKERLDPVEHEAFATIDNALLRLVSRLDPTEVSAWSVLRFMFNRDKRGDLLASQEQTPDYEAAAEVFRDAGHQEPFASQYARLAVDAALVGFHPQPQSSEVPT